MPARVSDKLVNQIVERIHAKIALGEYRPGDRLRQEMLAEHFSVSRTPVREALRLLLPQGRLGSYQLSFVPGYPLECG
jgi:DNA-binding GntR family transcriptional regulator